MERIERSFSVCQSAHYIHQIVSGVIAGNILILRNQFVANATLVAPTSTPLTLNGEGCNRCFKAYCNATNTKMVPLPSGSGSTAFPNTAPSILDFRVPFMA